MAEPGYDRNDNMFDRFGRALGLTRERDVKPGRDQPSPYGDTRGREVEIPNPLPPDWRAEAPPSKGTPPQAGGDPNRYGGTGEASSRAEARPSGGAQAAQAYNPSPSSAITPLPPSGLGARRRDRLSVTRMPAAMRGRSAALIRISIQRFLLTAMPERSAVPIRIFIRRFRPRRPTKLLRGVSLAAAVAGVVAQEEASASCWATRRASRLTIPTSTRLIGATSG